MSRKKPRSPGVSLGNRGAGFHRYDDEVSADGGKARLHRKVRRFLRKETRRIAAEEAAPDPTDAMTARSEDLDGLEDSA